MSSSIDSLLHPNAVIVKTHDIETATFPHEAPFFKRGNISIVIGTSESAILGLRSLSIGIRPLMSDELSKEDHESTRIVLSGMSRRLNEHLQSLYKDVTLSRPSKNKNERTTERKQLIETWQNTIHEELFGKPEFRDRNTSVSLMNSLKWTERKKLLDTERASVTRGSSA